MQKLYALMYESYTLTSLPERDFKLYCLISKYEDKASPRLLKIKQDLWAKAVERPNLMKNLVYTGNPFLTLMDAADE